MKQGISTAMTNRPSSPDPNDSAMMRRAGGPRSREQHQSDILAKALRDSYRSTVEEGVPDLFQDLIAKLK